MCVCAHACVCARACVCLCGGASFHGPQVPCPVGQPDGHCRGLEARVPEPGFSEGAGEPWLVGLADRDRAGPSLLVQMGSRDSGPC